MHEISLVQNLFSQLESLAATHEAKKVLEVTIQIGPLSGVVVDSFRFGFETLSLEHPLIKGAELIIEKTEVIYICSQCRTRIADCRDRPEKCPACGDMFFLSEGGDELLLQNVVMQ